MALNRPQLQSSRRRVNSANMIFTIGPRRFSTFSFGLSVITAAGFLLRVLAARGELWLDEIWTLLLLEDVSSWHEVFWNIPHVNNHVLNSLWLWFVGADAHPIWQRFASILLGTATIPVAALFIRRHGGDAAGLATALIFACGHIFVHYGSEARGYSGLILMTVLCADAADRFIAEPQRKGPVFQFALFGMLGSFFHLVMIASMSVIGASASFLLLAKPLRFRDKGLPLLRLAVAAVVGVAPAIVCFRMAGILKGHVVLGAQEPFTFADLTEGLAGAARSTLGLQTALPDFPVVSIAAIVACAALRVCPPRLMPASIVALFLLPALEVWFEPPNLHYARFHLPAACFLGLLAGASLGFSWNRGGWRKIVAITVAAVGLAGHAALLSQLLFYGRDACADAVARMTSAGPARYETNAPETPWVVEHHLRRLGGRDLSQNHPQASCAKPPDWYLLTTGRQYPEGRDMENFGPAECKNTFARVAHYPAAPLSGMAWMLYRRSP